MKKSGKTKPLRSMVGLVIVAVLLAGCAGQNPRSGQTTASQMPLKPHPIEDTSAQPAQTASEVDTLLEDDWFDEEDGAEPGEEPLYTVADPLEKLNRLTFYVNDKLYFWLLKPVAVGYRAVFPAPVRTGVNNFFNNLTAPVRLVNTILQGKGQAAEAELAKFLYNTTAGVLGFGNPAKEHATLNPDSEDLGQTLATYGLGDGFFLMLPLLGPSTLRDSAGLLGDGFLTPTSYIQPMEASLALRGYNVINKTSFRIGDYEALKRAALDPYEATRNAYLQFRQVRIKQ